MNHQTTSATMIDDKNYTTIRGHEATLSTLLRNEFMGWQQGRVIFTQVTLGMVSHAMVARHKLLYIHVRCYSHDLGFVFSNSLYHVLQESIITLTSTNFTLKPLFSPSSLMCFPTLGMVFQYASQILYCLYNFYSII